MEGTWRSKARDSIKGHVVAYAPRLTWSPHKPELLRSNCAWSLIEATGRENLFLVPTMKTGTTKAASPFSRPNYVAPIISQDAVGACAQGCQFATNSILPTNRVNGASRHTWSSFQHNESIPMIVMSAQPPHSRPLLSNSPGQRHVAHCPQGQPNAPREARGSSTPEEPWKVSSPYALRPA